MRRAISIVTDPLPGPTSRIRAAGRGLSRCLTKARARKRLLGKIAPPVNPRNLSFGDKDLRTLYMVGNSIFRVRLDVAGSVQY